MLYNRYPNLLTGPVSEWRSVNHVKKDATAVLPAPLLALVLEFVGHGRELCFALTSTDNLRRVGVHGGPGPTPPLSVSYFLSTRGLVSWACLSLPPVQNEYNRLMFFDAVAKYGMVPEARALRALSSPFSWGSHDTMQVAVTHDRTELVKWMRAQTPPCPGCFEQCAEWAPASSSTRAYFDAALALLSLCRRFVASDIATDRDRDSAAAAASVSDSDRELAPLPMSMSPPKADLWAEIRAAIDAGADVRSETEAGGTPLSVALSGADTRAALKLCELLLDSGADVDFRGSLFGYIHTDEQLRHAHNPSYQGRRNERMTGKKAYPPLHLACARGLPYCVALFLARGADVDLRDHRGYTALMHACSADAVQPNNPDIVRMLLEKGADVNAVRDGEGTALRHACLIPHAREAVEVIELLVGRGAYLEVTDFRGALDGDSPLVVACNDKKYPSHIAATLISLGASPHAVCMHLGCTPLIGACGRGMESEALQLMERGANVNAHDKQGATALQHAIKEGMPALALALLARGANVNATHIRHGHSPLTLACDKGGIAFHDVVHALVAAGADVRHKNEYGSCALTLACRNRNPALAAMLVVQGADVNAADLDGCTPLIVASSRQLTDTVMLLVDQGADVNARGKNGYTPLIMAGYQGLGSVCLRLVHEGADVDAQDVDGYTPCMTAASNGLRDVMALLLELGADLGAQADNGFTALILACYKGHADIALSLIDAGADVCAVDESGGTALLWSCEQRLTTVALQLISNGADVATANDEGCTPLRLARERGLDAVVTALEASSVEGQ